MEFQELNNDQRREAVNSHQRYAAYRETKARADAYRGSMVWTETKGHEYLVRSYYDKTGIRRQSFLGPRSQATEKTKLEYDRGRMEAERRLKDLKVVITRQAAINRAIGLGRVPLLGVCPSNQTDPRILKQMESKSPNISRNLTPDGRSRFFCFVPQITQTGS